MEKIQIKFKKLRPDAVMPTQGTPGSAGWDLTAVDYAYNPDYDTVDYDTGIAVEIPKGFVGLLFPRSSIYKNGMELTNCVGVIDSDYRGDIGAKFVCGGYRGEKTRGWFREGDRIGQLVIVPIPAVEFVEAETLSETERGAGGYGSTGR